MRRSEERGHLSQRDEEDNSEEFHFVPINLNVVGRLLIWKKLRDKFKYFGKVRNSSSMSSSSSEMMSQVTASQLEAQAPVLWLVQCAAYGTIVPYRAQRTSRNVRCARTIGL